MGNSLVSDESYGSVMIILKTTKYSAGDQINGFVNVNLKKPFPSPKLFLQIEGREDTQGVDYYTTTGFSNFILIKRSKWKHSISLL